jgi:hypothetical protein
MVQLFRGCFNTSPLHPFPKTEKVAGGGVSLLSIPSSQAALLLKKRGEGPGEEVLKLFLSQINNSFNFAG